MMWFGKKLDSDNNWIPVLDDDNDPKVLSGIKPGSYRVFVTDKEENLFNSPTLIASGPVENLT